jgi:hypothetical protein
MTGKKPTGPLPPGKALASYLIRWRILTEAVRDHLCDLSHAMAQNTRLEKLAAEILTSLDEEKALTARLRAVVRERRAKVVQARDLRNRLAAAVLCQYGLRSEKLREFGLKPVRPRRTARARKEVRRR